MDEIFEITALENPGVANFIEIGHLLVFGHFLGDPPQKNLSFFWSKNVRTETVDVIFGTSAPFESLLEYRITVKFRSTIENVG